MAQVLTVFRSRLRPEGLEAYLELNPKVTELAKSMPGFVESKSFEAPDGERITVVVFADRASHNAWRDHPEHQAAKRRGLAEFYDEFSTTVALVEVEHRWQRS